MRQQISVDLPRSVGKIIEKGIVECILIKTENKDIIIHIKENEAFEEDNDPVGNAIFIEIKKD